jgi:hypothetical protein
VGTYTVETDAGPSRNLASCIPLHTPWVQIFSRRDPKNNKSTIEALRLEPGSNGITLLILVNPLINADAGPPRNQAYVIPPRSHLVLLFLMPELVTPENKIKTILAGYGLNPSRTGIILLILLEARDDTESTQTRDRPATKPRSTCNFLTLYSVFLEEKLIISNTEPVRSPNSGDLVEIHARRQLTTSWFNRHAPDGTPGATSSVDGIGYGFGLVVPSIGSGSSQPEQQKQGITISFILVPFTLSVSYLFPMPRRKTKKINGQHEMAWTRVERAHSAGNF